jgi:hypothetical protein
MLYLVKRLDITWSEMVNLTAVTTVLLVRAEGDDRYPFNIGNNSAGLINVNLPKHSATTFLVPSSGHSQWLSNILLQKRGNLHFEMPGKFEWPVVSWCSKMHFNIQE